MRWRRDDRQQPDDRPDLAAEDWLREFRPVRPDALTAADRDAARSAAQNAATADRDRRAEPAGYGGGAAGRSSPVRASQDDRDRGRPQQYGSSRVPGGDTVPAVRPEVKPAERPEAMPAARPEAMPAARPEANGWPERNSLPKRNSRTAGNGRPDSKGLSETSGGPMPPGAPSRPAQPAAGGHRPHRNEDEYLDGRILPPRRYSRRGDSLWQRPDTRRGSYPEAPRPDEAYRPGPRNGFAPPARDEYAPGPDGYPQRRDDGYQGHRDDGYSGYDHRADDPGAYDRPGYDHRADDPGAYDRPGYDHRADDPGAYGRSGYDPRAGGRPGYDPRAGGRPGYDPRAGGRPGYDPRAGDRPGYDPRAGDQPGYDQRAYNPGAYDRPAYDRPAPSPQRPGTNGLASPGSRPEQQTAGYERPAESKADLVPVQNQVAKRAEYKPADPDDDTLTSPLPVILPGATAVPRPAPVEAPRGPFEPALPSDSPGRPVSVTGSVEPPPINYQPPVPPPPRSLPPSAAAKLDQLQDLYFTAEAIGEDALDKHFDQVSQRQQDLISEFFKQSEPSD